MSLRNRISLTLVVCAAASSDAVAQSGSRAEHRADAWFERGLIAQDRCDWTEAARLFTACLDAEPGRVDALIARSRSRLRLGDAAGAVEDADGAVQLFPGSLRARLARADACRGAGRLKEAKDDYEIAIGRGRADAVLYTNCAQVSEALGSASMKYHDAAVLADPGSAYTWHNRGKMRLKNGWSYQALADLERAAELDPANAILRKDLGDARLATRDYVGAIRDYTWAAAHERNYASAVLGRGEARQALGDLEGALVDYTAAVELDPRQARAWQFRGSAHRDLGSHEAALADLTTSLELDPGAATTWEERATTRLGVQDFDDALTDLDEAIRLQPDWESPRTTRGALLFRAGKYSAAAEDFGVAVSWSGVPVRSYRMLLCWMARIRAGERNIGQDEFEAFDRWRVHPDKSPWMDTMIGYALGKLDRDGLLAAAEAGSGPEVETRIGEASLLIAINELAGAADAEAKADLEKAVSVKSLRWEMRVIARSELDRLQK